MLDAGRKQTLRDTIREATNAAESEGKPTLVLQRRSDGMCTWWWCEDFGNYDRNTWWDRVWIEPDGSAKIMNQYCG